MRLLLLILASLTQSLQSADQFIDDAALKSKFREGLAGILEEKKGLSAAEVRRELKREKSMETEFVVEEDKEVDLNYSSSELYKFARETSLIVGHLYLCDSCDEWHTNLAGGVAISPDGVILTNYHVLQFEKAAIFGAMNSKGEVFPLSQVIASSRRDDVAMIQLDSSGRIPFARLAQESPVGARVALVSHPDSHFYTFSSGEISRYSIDPKLRTKRIEITAAFARGSSGSGIFDYQGRLVGLASATNAVYYEEDDSENRNLQMVIHSGVPIQSVRKLLVPKATD